VAPSRLRFRGEDARPWPLGIVRSAYYTWLQQNPEEQLTEFDEDLVRVDPYFANPDSTVLEPADRYSHVTALSGSQPRYGSWEYFEVHDGIAHLTE
jgi:hypothetical protein